MFWGYRSRMNPRLIFSRRRNNNTQHAGHSYDHTLVPRNTSTNNHVPPTPQPNIINKYTGTSSIISHGIMTITHHQYQHQHATTKVVEPLRDLLSEVLLRLEVLEGKVGITTNSSTTTTGTSSTTSTSTKHHPLSSGSNHTKGTMDFENVHCKVCTNQTKMCPILISHF